MKLAGAFGNLESLRIKSFELGGHTFKVHVPLSKDLDAMQERMTKVDEVKSQERYAKLTAKFVDGVDGAVFSENDIVVDGRSMRDLVKTISIVENRIVEYVKLLVPVEGTLEDLTYDDIEAEFPMQVQLELVDKISESIQPGYKEARKN
jgi:hypothetical protein